MDFKKKVLEKKLEVIFFMKFWFLKFYVSGLNEIDFTGITHMKVGFKQTSEIYGKKFLRCTLRPVCLDMN